VALLSAAVMASAAFLGAPTPAMADDPLQTIVEGPLFKGYKGE
jgi:hypothetical protein